MDKPAERYTEIMKWEWKVFKCLARIRCWLTKHRYDVIKRSGWERMEWQSSKCGTELIATRDSTV